jgi:putative protease
MAIAAIHGGADAIYVGVPGFNARGRTQDFSIAELKELIDLCHLYGVKVHLAFNVLIFEDELNAAAELLQELIPLGPDAFIVQDLGLVRLIRAMAPNMRIHGSTQMTVTNDEAIRVMDDLNIQRFVLGRENALEEIKTIRAGTQRELEVFVHGALCVAYSGQCFTSESLGGRSANRGQCAQSCRLGYEMFVDGAKTDLGDKKYLVSPQDLCGIEEVPELMKIGVDSFKVEGRLKGPEYVVTAAQSYQQAIAGSRVSKTPMAMSYSRGFFSGWLHGVDHQRLVEGSYSAHRGLEIGVVDKVLSNGLILITNEEVVAGHGLLFARGDQEIGGKVYRVQKLSSAKVQVTMLAGFEYQKVKPAMRAWINSDDRLSGEVKKLTTDRNLMKRIALEMKLTLKLEQAAELIVTDPEGRSITVTGPVGVPAQKPLTASVVFDELGALGNTAYRLESHRLEGHGVYIAQKDLKTMRREAVEKMTAARLVVRNALENPSVLTKPVRALSTAKKVLNVVLREKGQVEDLLAALHTLEREHLGVVFLDYEFGKDYASSIEMLKAHGIKAGIATTRILKPREYYNLNIILRANPDAILVRNLGALGYLKDKGIELYGDFSLNVSNHMSAEYLLSKGLKSVCASYDLNEAQLSSLMQNVSSDHLEVTLHQYMPEFHMEHCVFAAFMSKGHSFKDCGKPCEKHKVELKDAYGNMHFLKADQECRNTLYRGSAQSAAYLLEKWQDGPRLWRCEALNERGETLIAKVNGYLNFLAGKISLSEAIARVGTHEKYGVTPGQLSASDAWKDRKKSQDVLA